MPYLCPVYHTQAHRDEGILCYDTWYVVSPPWGPQVAA